MMKDIELKNLPILINNCLLNLTKTEVCKKSQNKYICFYCQTNNENLSEEEFKCFVSEIIKSLDENHIIYDREFTDMLINHYIDYIHDDNKNDIYFYFYITKDYKKDNIIIDVSFLPKNIFDEFINQETLQIYGEIYKIQ